LTGSRGIHVVVPLQKKYHFDTVRRYARSLAQEFVSAFPSITTIELNKKKRGKKIFIDYLRNGFGATAVAPYAVRAQPGAPIATPLYWDECMQKSLQAQSFTINTIFERLGAGTDPWGAFFTVKNVLTGVQKIK
jgi:bifunctional non-homologous end joining protein LigD